MLSFMTLQQAKIYSLFDIAKYVKYGKRQTIKISR